MANRRPQQNSGRRVDFRNDRGKNFGRSGVSPWQGGGPGGGLPNLLPLGGGPTEATLALASNIINLLQPRQNPVPSLLDMPIRRDFGPAMGRFDRGFGPNRMGNQNFRRTGNYNRSGERINNNRKPFRPNDGPRQQNKSSPKKEADSKAKPKESEQEEKDVKEEPESKDSEEKKDVPKTRYDDINPQFLKCHICNKSMWDGRSFENHLSGRAHAIMMQKTAESYALTADTMRQEFKIREMKRTRKTGAQIVRDFYCAMCDMYAADGAAHRTTVGHRKLKKYLHPACTSCHKEMPTRIELDEHRLSAEHLRNMQDKQEVNVKPKPEVMVISTLGMEQSYLRDERARRRQEDRGGRGEGEGQDVEVKKEIQDGVEVKQEGEGVGEEEKKPPTDKDDTILDYNEGDDLTGVTPEQFPAYSVDRGVGRSFLSPFSCVQCRLCRKLLDSPATADVHLRTWRHHQLFTRLLAERGSTKQQNAEPSSSSSDNKRPHDSEESGNWKRRKTTPDTEDEADINGVDTQIKEEQPNETADTAAEEEGAGQGDAEGDGDNTLPPNEDLEDWEQFVDDENNQEDSDKMEQDEAEVQPEPEPVKEPEPEPEKPAPAPAPVSTPATASKNYRGNNTPRGRGRGRGRRY